MNEKEKKKIESLEVFNGRLFEAKETADRHLQATNMRPSERAVLKGELEEIGSLLKHSNSLIVDLLKEEQK